MRLLAEKEVGLCSRRYVQNKYQNAEFFGTKASTSSRNAVFQDMKGRFIYPDVAVDIKAHPFFRSIDWQNLHLMTPPK